MQNSNGKPPYNPASELKRLMGQTATGSKPRKRLEQELQIKCVEWFDQTYKIRDKYRLIHVPNGSNIGGKMILNKKTGKSFPIGAIIMRQMGLRKGFLDLILMGRGKIMIIEMKIPGESPKDEQEEWTDWLLKNGFLTRVCDNFSDFQRIVIDFCGEP